MKVEQFVVNVNSRQPEPLIAFYRDIVGLSVNAEFGPGAFMAGSSTFVAFIIEGHSEIQGVTKEPQRVLLNFFVRDLVSQEARLKERGVKFIMSATKEPGFGTVATFLDPDGNYCQLMELEGA
jgi:predicted enzyme related to lactoylglutathione lyase